MQPTLISGDYILATSLLSRFLKKNNLVIFFDKTHSYIIKRVKEVTTENIILKSDNKDTNSTFCQVPIFKNKRIYIVLFILKRKYTSFTLSLRK